MKRGSAAAPMPGKKLPSRKATPKPGTRKVPPVTPWVLPGAIEKASGASDGANSFAVTRSGV